MTPKGNAPQLAFRKIHGCGNNFIVLYDPSRIVQGQNGARALLDRNFGLGTDGLMSIGRADNDIFPVEMYNPDGSVCGMCGNGIRCVMRYLHLEGLVASSVDEVSFDVYGRRIVCTSKDQGRNVRVDMGPPTFDPRVVPIAAPSEFVDAEISHGDQHFRGTCVSMGNPHCVIFVPNLDAIALDQIGPALEHHALFPKRANIEFCQLLSPSRVRVLVWERGAGPTLACGTGACAVVVAGVRTQRLTPQATVELPGGSVEIDFANPATVYMTGPAEEICQGTIAEPLMTRMLEQR